MPHAARTKTAVTANVRVPAAAVELAHRFRREPTGAEAQAWRRLRGRRCLGLKFRRQQVISGYVVDFYCAELALVIEIDGSVHDEIERRLMDAVREERLRAAGVRHLLRVANAHVSRADFLQLLAPYAGGLGNNALPPPGRRGSRSAEPR